MIQFTTDLKCLDAYFGLFLQQGLSSLDCQGLRDFLNLYKESISFLHNERSLLWILAVSFMGCWQVVSVFYSHPCHCVLWAISLCSVISPYTLHFVRSPNGLESIFSAVPAHFQTLVAKSLMCLKEFFFQISWGPQSSIGLHRTT